MKDAETTTTASARDDADSATAGAVLPPDSETRIAAASSLATVRSIEPGTTELRVCRWRSARIFCRYPKATSGSNALSMTTSRRPPMRMLRQMRVRQARG